MIQIDQAKLFSQIDAVASLRGAGVVYIGEFTCTLLRRSEHPSGLETYIIIEESLRSETEVTPVAPAATKARLSSELIGLGLNCGSAVLTGLAVAGEVGAAPLTAGSSALLVYPTAVAAVGTSLQCGIAIGRVINHVFIDPRNNEQLDSTEWYRTTSDVLDAISLVGVGANAGLALKSIIRLRQASGHSFMKILKGMDRAERKRLAQDLARHASGATSNKQLKALIRAGKFPKIFSQQQVSQAMLAQLYGAISSALDVSASAWSGNVNKVIVHLFQE